MGLFEPIFHDERTLEKLQDALHKVILERDSLKRERDELKARVKYLEALRDETDDWSGSMTIL